MSKDRKYNANIILIATILLVIQRVLLGLTTVPEYTQNSVRFYLYHTLLIIVVSGINLIPLYIGFHWNQFKDKKLLSYLSRFYLIYWIIGFVINISIYLLLEKINIRDFWLLLFPISENYFQYSVSIIIGTLIMPSVFRLLDAQTNNLVRRLTSVLTIGAVVLPTLFGKDIFMFNSGKSLLWVIFLMLFGYVIQRFRLYDKVKHTFLLLCGSLLILLTMMFLMANISMILRHTTVTITRFSSPFSIFGFLYSVLMFLWIETDFSRKIRIRMGLTSISILLISTQLLLNTSSVVYYSNLMLKKSFPNSGSSWLLNIIYNTSLYLLGLIILFIIIQALQRLKFYRKIENTLIVNSIDDLLKKIKQLKVLLTRYSIYIWTLLGIYLFTFLQFILFHGGKSIHEWFLSFLYVLVKNQSTIVLTTLIIFGFVLLLILIFNHFWFAIFIVLIIDLLLTVANLLKLPLRQEPVLPSDLKMLTGASEILGMVDIKVLVVGLIALIILLVLAIYLQKKWNIKLSWRGLRRRCIEILLLVLALGSLAFVNHKNSPAYIVFNTFKVQKAFFNQAAYIKDNGPVIQFINNVDVTIMEQPNGYSKDKINTIMKDYDQYAKKINKKRNTWAKNQTFIFCLSESLSNPNRIPNLQISKNPLPYISQLEKTNGGLMLSTGYGGGTANMEWQSLTGMDLSNLSPTLATPYNQIVDAQDKTTNITNLFESKTAIHPFTATLYNRKNVFKKMGFDKFYYLDSPNKLTYVQKIDHSSRISDQSAYDETLKHLKETSTKTQFIQLSTMQNHMPYDNYYDKSNFSASGDALKDNQSSQLNTYMQGLSYTDSATKKFIHQLDKINKPITLVFYGDHLPALYTGNSMKKYGIIQHETDYFIYNNKYARNQSRVKKLNKVVGPYSFPAIALEQSNLKVTPFYALLQQVTKSIPASTVDPSSSVNNRYNGSKIFINEYGKVVSKSNLSKKQLKILHDYQLIQYDLTAGKEYSAKWASQKVK